MQPFVNVYTRFARADGKTVWLHMDQWEGQNWKRSPGNLFGEPVGSIRSALPAPIRLIVDKVIPPIQPPAGHAAGQADQDPERDSLEVVGTSHPSRRDGPAAEGLRRASRTPLSDELRTGALLVARPRRLRQRGALRHVLARRGDAADDLRHAPASVALLRRFLWRELGEQRAVRRRDHAGADSRDRGKFRVIREPWARTLSGGSTGGWIAAAHQVFYPDFYGRAFASCPDSLDFRYHQIVDIYKDANAYVIDKGWMKVDRPNQQRPDGNIQSMMKDENHYELVVGDKSRSGGQWDIWEATYSPVGADGYPKRLWDKMTGEIDKTVAETWRKYDLRHVLETNWSTLGPKVAHKLNVYVGDMDSYYLNNAVEKLNEFLVKAENPKFTGEIVFERRAPHCWGPRGAELMAKMIEQIEKHAPAGVDLKSWRY